MSDGNAHPVSAPRPPSGRHPSGRGEGESGPAPRGSFETFLSALRTFESGIDPDRFAWYGEHYRRPVMSYARTRAVGRPWRDPETGRLEVRSLTVEEYFDTLGVGDRFDPQAPPQEGRRTLAALQYASTNMLGFVGYQIGEAVLIDTGHYRAERVTRPVEGREQTLRSFYTGGVPESAWAAGRVEVLHHLEDPPGPHGAPETILATDCNRWRGTFTGLDGVRSFEDLQRPELQERVLRAIMAFNLKVLHGVLVEGGSSLGKALGRPGDPGAGRPRVSLSGLLAAAHLCGARGTASWLLDGRERRDELDTALTDYLERFGGYRTPWDGEALAALLRDGEAPPADTETTETAPAGPAPVGDP